MWQHWVAHAIMVYAIVRLSIDGLTGLWVRRVYHLLYRLNHRRGGWVLFIDLDGLKVINDTLGHVAGDHFLRRAGFALARASRLRAFRYGGDEFMVLTFNPKRQTAERILREFSKLVGDISFSAGVGLTEQEADAEMYKEKNKKKGAQK